MDFMTFFTIQFNVLICSQGMGKRSKTNICQKTWKSDNKLTIMQWWIFLYKVSEKKKIRKNINQKTKMNTSYLLGEDEDWGPRYYFTYYSEFGNRKGASGTEVSNDLFLFLFLSVSILGIAQITVYFWI